jgi:predicted amidohydrolase YtcJ
MKRKMIRVIGLFILVLGMMSCQTKDNVSLIVYNAKIYTVDDAFRTEEAMAIEDGVIKDLGTSAYILSKYHSAYKIDLNGKPVYPGFIDAHTHFTGYALDGWKIDLSDAKSFEDVLFKLQSVDTTQSEWIYGRSWDQHRWGENTFPTNERLNELFPNTPVFLKRVDGHAALVNEAAFKKAGIDHTFKIANGEIVMEKGKRTGMVIDGAMHYIEQFIEVPQQNQEKLVQQLQERCWRFGITGVQDCGISLQEYELLAELRKNEKLQLRVQTMLHLNDTILASLPDDLFTDEFLSMNGFKLYADGALGSRGACLQEPYQDKKGWYGFILSDKAQLKKLINQVAETKYQLVTHAIGDSANKLILRLYAEALEPGNDRRWRIEHAQVIDTLCLDYFKHYRIIPSVQPTHALDDAAFAESRLGKKRMKWAYAYKTLLETNGWMPLGTDFPVASMRPLQTFSSAVFRKNILDFGNDESTDNELLSRIDALKGMTIWSAQSAFQEKYIGSLEIGKFADFVILNQDIIEVPFSLLKKTQILFTFVNGKKVYQKALK